MSALEENQEWEAVNRIVFPTTDAESTLPLYVVNWTPSHPDPALFDARESLEKVAFSSLSKRQLSGTLRNGIFSAQEASKTELPAGSVLIKSRTSIELAAGQHVSLCTFFNAFPASYWQRWTKVTNVRFIAKVGGVGRIVVMKSSARGIPSTVTTIPVAQEDEFVEADISLSGFMDGGFIWADMESASNDSLTVTNAQWQVPTQERRAPHNSSLSIAITTFNRPSYCLNQLQTIAAEKNLRDHLDTIYCVDQGTDRVQDQPDFQQTRELLGQQLTYILQDNLGGSGGFSRGMYETVRAQKSAYVLLLDDDAITEPEAILRALQFSDYATRPVLVGGGMLHLDNRTVLYSSGERFDASSAMPAPATGTHYNHDFAVNPLRDTPELHKRINPDFNGWWLCLIPTEVLKKIGLSMPVFIKYDDVEFGLRAKENNIPTICLPGVAVWHQAWHDKDISRTWEEYFAQRNRWLCTLMHFPVPSKKFAFRMLYEDAHLGTKLLYSAMKLNHMALRDLTEGPEYIVRCLPQKLAEVRKAREGFTDSLVLHNLDDFPAALADYEPTFIPSDPKTVTKMGLKSVISAFFSQSSGIKDAHPQVSIMSKDAIWPAFNKVSSALVTTADGNGAAWFKRDSKLYRKELFRCVHLAANILKQWNKLSRLYRESDFCSINTWQRIFNQSSK